nr:AAA family ATPase [Nocardia sp. XZ_19_231]
MASPLRTIRPRVVYVGGYAGSGKSEFARTLARMTNWAILDKDTIARPLIEPALEDLGESINDRESDTYLKRLRPREYEALEGVVADNVAVGNSAIATAPYIREFTSRTWLDRVVAQNETYRVDTTFIWVRCSLESMLFFLRKRGAGRDTAKLADWDRYSAGLDLDFRPEADHVVIDNDLDSPPMRVQAEQLIDSFRHQAAK